MLPPPQTITIFSLGLLVSSSIHPSMHYLPRSPTHCLTWQASRVVISLFPSGPSSVLPSSARPSLKCIYRCNTVDIPQYIIQYTTLYHSISIGILQYIIQYTTVYHSISIGIPQYIIQYTTVYHSISIGIPQYIIQYTTVYHSISIGIPQYIIQYTTVYHSISIGIPQYIIQILQYTIAY